MRRLIFIAAVALFACTYASASMYVETFSTGSDSWNYGYGTSFTPGVTTWNATGGNPGGYISGATQNLYAVWTYVTAPYGDMTGLTMTIDTKVTNSDTGNAQFYVGKGGTYFIDGTWAIGADRNWTTHTVALDATHFTPWTGQNDHIYTLAEVLQAPTDIGIFFGGSLANGTGNLEVDNFGVVPVPVPAAVLLGLLGLGSAGFKLRRFA